MADTKLTDLTALTAPALADQVYIVDTSDTTDDAAGTSKRILLSDLIKAIGGKVPLQTITLGSAGEFDFDSIPGGYKRLIIEGSIRGNVAATSDDIYCIFNEDTTVANYHQQNFAGFNNGSSFTEQATPRTLISTAASSPANAYTPVRVVVEDYAGSNLKTAVGGMNTLLAAGNIFAGVIGMYSSITAAITRIRIRVDNHPTDGLIGELTLYGEL